MAKNCKLLEDGFDAEYFESIDRRSIERTERWTQARFEWEMAHSEYIDLIYSVIVFAPVVYMIGRMLWHIYTR